MEKVKHTINGIDREIVRIAKASAAMQGKTGGQWWADAAREKVAREKVNNPTDTH